MNIPGIQYYTVCTVCTYTYEYIRCIDWQNSPIHTTSIQYITHRSPAVSHLFRLFICHLVLVICLKSTIFPLLFSPSSFLLKSGLMFS